MTQIKFSHNWNNKLNCTIFSTIRKSTAEKHFFYLKNIGQKFNIIVNDKKYSKAELRSVYFYKYKDIPKILLSLDVGDDDTRTIREIFRKLGFKNDTECLILLFKKTDTYCVNNG